MSLFDLCPETGLAITPPMAVRPEMIDYNGHVNVAFYVKLFDEGLDILFERIGLSRTYVETRQMSFFALEAHVRYLREISLTDRVRMRLRILDLDPKRIHYWMELVHADESWLSATMESISIHVDMASRRPAPFPDDIMARLTAWHAADAQKPRPEGVGQVIGISRKA